MAHGSILNICHEPNILLKKQNKNTWVFSKEDSCFDSLSVGSEALESVFFYGFRRVKDRMSKARVHFPCLSND